MALPRCGTFRSNLIKKGDYVYAAGQKGVSFFFMLSGAILAYDHRGRIRLGTFYRRRVARIVPAYLLAFLAAQQRFQTARPLRRLRRRAHVRPPSAPRLVAGHGLCIPIFLIAIVAGAASDHNRERRFFSGRRAVSFGLWSYAFYSLHANVLAMVEGVVHRPPTSPVVGAAALAAIIAATWFISALVYRRWEEPARARISISRGGVPRPPSS